MADIRIENLAKTIVHYSTKIRAGDHVAIIGSPLAEDLIKEIFRYTLRAGGYPYPFLGIELLRGMDGLDEILFKEASDEQLQHIPRTDRMIMEDFEVMISIRSQANTRSLTQIDPAGQVMRARARSGLMERFFQRAAEGSLRWCTTLFPTQAYAQDAEMSLAEFADYLYGATFADQPDPIAEWHKIREQQQKLVDWLKGKRHVQVRGPDVELELSIEGRTFINSDGAQNMPSGEIFTGPVEESVNGWVRFTYPAVLDGREVEGVSLRFEDGRVTHASADKNQDFLMKMLEVDAGARYLGEWAIGTNKRINRFIKNILLDEKIGGTFHLALGAGYPQTGSKNKSGIHWDMICDMRSGGEIYVDGELFYRSGEFMV